MFDFYFAGMRFNTTTGSEEQIKINKFMLEKKVNCLLSYINDKKSIKECFESDFKGKLFIDSGAYSAWTKGKTINVDEYIDFLNNNDDRIYIFAQVDVIPGIKHQLPTREQVEDAASRTWNNYLYMREKLKSPDKCLYTFHVGEPIKYLKRALEWKDSNGKHIPYIALGGMVGRSTTIRDNFINVVVDTISRSSNPNVKIHAFGMTSRKLLYKYPNLTSADSTKWIKYAANGLIQSEFMDSGIRIGCESLHMREHITHLPQQEKDRIDAILKKRGLTIEEMIYSNSNRLLYNVQYSIDLAAQIDKHRKNNASSAKRRALF